MPEYQGTRCRAERAVGGGMQASREPRKTVITNKPLTNYCMKQYKHILSIVIFGLLVSNSASATTLTAGPYLQRLGDSAVTIMARTDSDTSLVIRYRKAGTDKWRAATASATGTKHRFRLTSLKADTTYEYYVRDNSKHRLTPIAELHTQHTISKANPLQIAVVGDSGTNTVPQYAVGAQISAWNPDIMVHTGDIAYDSGTSAQFLSEVFAPYQSLFTHVPFYGSIGNHDFVTNAAEPYKDFFETPHGTGSTEDYYSFDYDGVHLISLNTNIDYSVDSDQYHWLKADLKQAKKDKALWTMVFFHHPVYSSGMHGTTTGMAAILSPLFEQYGVDLVLNGHDHNYERMESVDGVNYLVSGGGGAVSLYGQDHPELNPYTVKFVSAYHFVGLTIRPQTIAVQAIDSTGKVIDHFKIKQDHTVK